MAVTAHPSRLRVGSPDYLIVAAVAALVVLGIIAVYSSSFALGILEYGDANNPGRITKLIPPRGNTTGNPDYTYAASFTWFGR